MKNEASFQIVHTCAKIASNGFRGCNRDIHKMVLRKICVNRILLGLTLPHIFTKREFHTKSVQ